MERYEANILCQHSQTSIQHVQRGFVILMKLKNLPYLSPYINSVYQNLSQVKSSILFRLGRPLAIGYYTRHPVLKVGDVKLGKMGIRT